MAVGGHQSDTLDTGWYWIFLGVFPAFVATEVEEGDHGLAQKVQIQCCFPDNCQCNSGIDHSQGG